MPTKGNVLDAIVLSLISTVWLYVPAHLESLNRPFATVASASLTEMPIVLAAAVLWCFVVRRKAKQMPGGGSTERFFFFAFMAYFWSLVDDGPVDFDSVLTWPKVTGGPQHVFLEILLHVLTLGFLFLALREPLKGSQAPAGRRLGVAALGLASFWASYFQNTPFAGLENLRPREWYTLDAVEHLVAVILLWIAVREAAREQAVPDPFRRSGG